MPQNDRQTTNLTVLFTCVGRRIELMQAFRASARRMGLALHVVALDHAATAPGLYCADTARVVPPVRDAGYIEAVIAAARATHADLLIPTIDHDLGLISAQRAAFSQIGCVPLIAEPAVIETCRDKLKTFEFFKRHGVDTPATYLPGDLLQRADLKFPYFLKPRYGSASASVHRLNDHADLEYYAAHVGDAIIQDFAFGTEHTLDVYVGLSGVVRTVVPRARWEVRSGEVSKGVVVKDLRIMEAGRRVVQALGASVRGVITLQCIVSDAGQIRFIEINPRFGGGAPLSIAAGADFPAWLMAEWRGEDPAIEFDGFTHGLYMLRYDWSIFATSGTDLRPQPGKPLHHLPEFE
jgi:carbamoyl-phosphate synthase large subunit